ncbi:phosphoribosyltransferase, partial [Rugamonas sp. FT82W]|nr:phosphoribosyltransferase [Duganella vulcania]
MRLAVRVARDAGAARIVVAVPVAPQDECAALKAEADELVCLRTPSPFYAVGHWYRDFEQVGDEQVAHLLEQAWSAEAARAPD